MSDENVVSAFGGQESLFGPSEPVLRPPGWLLIANLDGVQGWHLVDHTTPDRGVATVCGIAGRVVRDEAPMIVRCPICSSADAS